MRRALLIEVLGLVTGCTRAQIIDRDAGRGTDAGIATDADARVSPGLDAGTRVDAGCAYTPVDTEGMPEGCVLRRPPGRPLCGDEPTGREELFFALRSLTLDPGAMVGLDQREQARGRNAGRR